MEFLLWNLTNLKAFSCRMSFSRREFVGTWRRVRHLLGTSTCLRSVFCMSARLGPVGSGGVQGAGVGATFTTRACACCCSCIRFNASFCRLAICSCLQFTQTKLVRVSKCKIILYVILLHWLLLHSWLARYQRSGQPILFLRLE